MSLRHKPLLRPRAGERVERDRKVHGAWRGGRPDDSESGSTDLRPSAPAQALFADEPADEVVARSRHAQLHGRFSHPPPRLRSRLCPVVQADDERVQAGVETTSGEPHLPTVPEDLRSVCRGFVA